MRLVLRSKSSGVYPVRNDTGQAIAVAGREEIHRKKREMSRGS